MKPADPSNPHPAPSTGAAHPAHPAQVRTTHLARKLGSLFKGVLSGKIQLSGDAGNDANSPLAVWKATHGHGGSKPVVPRLPPKPVPKPKAPVGKAGRKGKGALVAPRRPVIQVIERARPALVRGTAVGGKMVAVGGTAAAPSGIVVPPAPQIINPYAGWSQNDVKDRIRQLLGDVEVPRFRKAVFETLRRLRDPDTTPGKIMEVMSVDAQLVGKVMNTVNSTAYSPKSKVQSLDHAIMLMGNADLERIVMIVGSKAALPSQTHPKFALGDFWKASSRRAVLARELADIVQPSKANLSFTAGFLQDLSVPLIVSSKKDDYMKIFSTAVDEKRDLHALEHETLGWDHAEVGALVALNWELPEDVMLCLKDHNEAGAVTRPDPAHYVSTLHASHGEEWNEIFAGKVGQRYQVPREALDEVCNNSVSKAAELAKLF
jgi:HD-like signal output (HDOD) protein